MAISTGAYIRPIYGAAYNPSTPVLSDPAFAGIIDLEIVGGTTSTGKQASFTWWPAILHAFYNWKAQSPTVISAGVPMQTSGVRYVLFDDTPTINVTNKYANGSIGILCFASAHNFYVGQYVTIAGVGSSFNGTVKVTAINSAIGTGVTTVYNITFANVNTVASSASTGTVQAGAVYWNGASNTTFTNITDTTGLNGTNLGPRRWIDYVRALYQKYSVTPPTVLVTWRTGAVDSSHNMENASAWQQNSTTDEFAPSYIAAGNHDAYIQAFASQIADYIFANQTQVIQIRIDQEVNGNNYSWAYNNQWLEPTNSVTATATPDNGASLLNALTQTASSGNPIATSGGSSGSGGYGLYAGMWRHIVSLAKTTITNQLIQNHGMGSGAAATLAANVQFVWCVGSGSLITASTGAPIANPPYPQVPHTYGATGGSTAMAYTISSISVAGGNTTLTVTPGTDYVANASNTYSLIGHGIPVGAQVAPTSGGTGDLVTAVTNTTVTFATGSNVYSVGGSVTLAGVSSYVASAAPWASFYPGNDVVDVVSIDGYNPSKTTGTWKNFWSGGSGGNIFPTVYPAVVGFVDVSKPFQISETGSVEGGSGTPTKAQWFYTNLAGGGAMGAVGQLQSNMSRVTSLVYFDQGGRNSGYQVRTSSASFAEWQKLGAEPGWTSLGTLPASPPITTGVPVTVIVIRNNTKANLANETSNSVAEWVYASDEHWVSMGDGASAPVPASVPWLPLAPAGELTTGNVLTATAARAAAFQPPAAALGATNGVAVLGGDASLTAAQTNVVLTSGTLTAGAWYVLMGSMLVAQPTTVNITDLYFVLGTASLTSGTLTGTTIPKATAAAGTASGTVSAIVQINGAGTITLNGFPAGAVAFTAKRFTQAGASSIPATWLSWFRIA